MIFLGTQTPNDFLNKQFAITGTIELLYSDTTYKTLGLAGTQQAIRIDVKDTTVTLGTGTNPEIKIDLYKAKLTEWAKTVNNNDLVKQTLKFKAFYSASDSKMFAVTLVNTINGYN